MKKSILILFFGIFILGCSSNEGDNTLLATPVDFKLIIDGVEIDYPNTDGGTSGANAYKKGDVISVIASHGNLSTADSNFYMVLKFTKGGKFLTGYLVFNSYSSGNPMYASFYNFPSHYIQTTDFSLDEVQKKIKLKFDGNLYSDNQSLSSEARNIQGEVDMVYIDDGDEPYPLVINNIEQYCRANLNSTPWVAKFEDPYSSFTNEDDYKIEINFDNTPTPATYNFTSASTSNYVRLSKFNTVTVTYDYYNVTGVVAYSYREFHGGARYSFIGTFSFTAVNPNNASDVIQVTDGVFRSYQQF